MTKILPPALQPSSRGAIGFVEEWLIREGGVIFNGEVKEKEEVDTLGLILTQRMQTYLTDVFTVRLLLGLIHFFI